MPRRARDGPESLLPPLAHEVSNLLAAIRLSSHLLLGASDARERARLARDVDGLAAQGGELLSQIRPLVGDGDGRRVRVAVAEVLDSVGRAFPGTGSEGAPPVVGRAPRTIADVRVDPDALHHVLLILTRAALGAAGGEVRLGARQQGTRVVFEVRDRGGPLELGAGAASPPPSGRELGIRLADAVMRRSRGRVEAQRSRGETRVRVILPAVGR